MAWLIADNMIKDRQPNDSRANQWLLCSTFPNNGQAHHLQYATSRRHQRYYSTVSISHFHHKKKVIRHTRAQRYYITSPVSYDRLFPIVHHTTPKPTLPCSVLRATYNHPLTRQHRHRHRITLDRIAARPLPAWPPPRSGSP